MKDCPDSQSTKPGRDILLFVCLEFFGFVLVSGIQSSLCQNTGWTQTKEQTIYWPYVTRNKVFEKKKKDLWKITRQNGLLEPSTNKKETKPWGKGRLLIYRVITIFICPVVNNKITKHRKKTGKYGPSKGRKLVRMSLKKPRHQTY